MPDWLALPVLCEEVEVCWRLAGGSLGCFAIVVSMELPDACRRRCILKEGATYTALDSSDKETLEDLAGLVAVADVLECLGRVLAADVEHDFFTAGVLVYEACGARGEWLVWFGTVGFGWSALR